MHVAAVLIGALLMAIGIGHLIAGSLQLMELQSEVNQQLPHRAKFEPLFWWLFQVRQLRRYQRDLLPESPRPRKATRFRVIGFSLFLLGIGLLLHGMKGLYK